MYEKYLVLEAGKTFTVQQYVNEEINSYSEKKAEYIARSGIDIVVNEIENGKLDEHLKKAGLHHENKEEKR